MRVTRLDYCQYLLVSQKNYTLTNFADHAASLSHDQINRYLKSDKLTPKLLWEHVKGSVIESKRGYILFDDTIVDKNFSHSIEGVRRQYSGNSHGIIKGVGVVTCVYVNPETEQFWAIDYRIFDPDIDGKSKLGHVNDMLNNIVYRKEMSFSKVMMDSWYATKYLMLKIEEMGKIYYCPLKKNRLVDDSCGAEEYKQIQTVYKYLGLSRIM
ncbi:MAG: transposase [Rickettsiales bacterium]|nr:transposase [Pseudomonadota bacterium]MDA0965975.1 transposase [Pseudomonadota bacterium]MDG4542554.1 transposase [Rickettsiales bacterium]MDG4545058.1 transposase [Rickettsiales bacterium]MDG4547181.1 transposase [Rickettsiales bacterium]